MICDMISRVGGERTGRQPGYRLGVDIGGTFTDVVLLAGDGSVRTRKVLSTPADYAQGVVEGIRSILREADVAPAAITGVVHAGTVASNAILERRGARVGLITTEGFRDVLEMRRLRIPVLYDLQYEKPPPLVPRERRFEVRERLGPRGATWTELDEASVRDAAERLAAQGIEALAISLLHSYADDAHERRVEELVRERLGDGVFVTRSADILPEVREYERTSTAVVNAYLGPTVGRYVESLSARLSELGIEAPLEIMQSSGGTLPPEVASPQARASRRVGPGRRCRRLRPARPAHRPAQPDLPRHGRHDREGGAARGRRAGADGRVRGGGGDQPLEQARQGRRLRDQASRSSTSPRSARAEAASSRRSRRARSGSAP